MKKLLENKSHGFYVTFVSVVASIVCAAVYASMYSGSRYMEWPAVVAMLVGAAVSLVLMFTKKAGWARVCTAMFAVLQVLNLVNVFLKQVKEEA